MCLVLGYLPSLHCLFRRSTSLAHHTGSTEKGAKSATPHIWSLMLWSLAQLTADNSSKNSKTKLCRNCKYELSFVTVNSCSSLCSLQILPERHCTEVQCRINGSSFAGLKGQNNVDSVYLQQKRIAIEDEREVFQPSYPYCNRQRSSNFVHQMVKATVRFALIP